MFEIYDDPPHVKSRKPIVTLDNAVWLVGKLCLGIAFAILADMFAAPSWSRDAVFFTFGFVLAKD